MTHNFNIRFRNVPGLNKISAKILDWLSETVMIFHLRKSPPKNKWQKSFENVIIGNMTWVYCYDVMITILTLEESCPTLSQEITTGVLTSESNAAFFRSSRQWSIMNLLLKARKLIKIFIWQFWDVCGMWYKESDLKCELQEAGSSNTIMCLLTQWCQLDDSWQNIQFLTFHNPPIHLTSPLPIFSIP
jgi:hypothetical protein